MKRITNFFNASETRLPRGNAPPTPPLAPDVQVPAFSSTLDIRPLSVNSSSVASRHTLAPPDMGYGDSPIVSGNSAPYLYPLPPSPGMLPSRPGTSSGVSGFGSGSGPGTPYGSNFNLSSVNLSTAPVELITARKSRDARFDKLGAGLAWRLACGDTQDLESYDCGPLLRGERVCWHVFFVWLSSYPTIRAVKLKRILAE